MADELAELVACRRLLRDVVKALDDLIASMQSLRDRCERLLDA